MNETSIDWLLKQLERSKTLYDNDGYAIPEEFAKVIEQAKAMHKQEMNNAYMTGQAGFEAGVQWAREQYQKEGKL